MMLPPRSHPHLTLWAADGVKEELSLLHALALPGHLEPFVGPLGSGFEAPAGGAGKELRAQQA